MFKNDLIPWRCKNNRNHILGQVQQRGHGESKLLIYQQAVDLTIEHPDEPVVRAVAEGFMTITVPCSICCPPNNARVWAPSEEAMARLIQSHLRMVQNQKLLEVER